MTASTVAQYLAALPADRRAALSAVRKAINENLPDGYEEGMQFGMIGWYVPLSYASGGLAARNPKVPLSFVAFASQKSGMVLHFLCFYGHPTLRDWFISEWSEWEERHRRKSREVAVSESGDERINTRRAARSSTWVKVASASKSWTTWLSTWSAARSRRMSRGGAHGQLPGGEGAHEQGKEQRKEGRQEIRGEEGETKKMTLATAFSEKWWLLT